MLELLQIHASVGIKRRRDGRENAVEEHTCPLSISIRRADGRNHFPLIPPINTEIRFVNGDDRMPGVKLAHSDEAQIGEIGAAVSVTLGKLVQAFQRARKIKDHVY